MDGKKTLPIPVPNSDPLFFKRRKDSVSFTPLITASLTTLAEDPAEGSFSWSPLSSPKDRPRSRDLSKSPEKTLKHKPRKRNPSHSLSPPKSTYHINLERIIEGFDNEVSRGRTSAYMTKEVMTECAVHFELATFNKCSVKDYIVHLTKLTTELQSKKFTLMKELVDILAGYYCRERRTKNKHSAFCHKILDLTDKSMSISLDGKQKNQVAEGWNAIAKNFVLEEQDELHYENKLNALIDCCEEAILYKKRNDIVVQHHLLLVESEECISYYSWAYLREIFSTHLQPKDIESFRQNYLKQKNSLEDAELVFIYDLFRYVVTQESGGVDKVIMDSLESAFKFCFQREYKRFMEEGKFSSLRSPPVEETKSNTREEFSLRLS